MRLRTSFIGIAAVLATLLVPVRAAAQPGVVSVNNSTTTALADNAVFTGTGEQVLDYKSVSVLAYASHASAASGLSLEFSSDGSNWDLKYQSTVSATTPKVVTLPVQARYFRVVYTNGGSAQTSFRLQSLFFSTQIPYTTASGNASMGVAEIGSTAVAVGAGVVGNGVQRVTLPTDGNGTIAAVTTSLTPGTAAANVGKAEDAASADGDTGVSILLRRNDTNTTVSTGDGDYVQPSADNYGVPFVRQDHPNRFRCTVTVSTATTIQAVGGSCAAPGAGLSLYITDVLFAASASGIGADAFPTLKYGTGGTCGTGTTVFWGVLTAAAVTFQDNRSIPIKIPANNEICWISSTAGSKFIVIGGFIAP